MNHSFFVRTVATTRFYFTCLLLNISAPHCGDLVPGRLTNEGTRRWQMSANGSRECVHDHDRSPLCGFGIRRRRFGRHDGCGRRLTDDTLADPAVRRHRSPRASRRRGPLGGWQLPTYLGWQRDASYDFTMTSSMSAAGTRGTDPADAVFASPC